MESTEVNTNKVLVSSKIDSALYDVLDQFRTEEDRSMSNLIERLLKTHPRIQEVLEAEPATAAGR